MLSATRQNSYIMQKGEQRMGGEKICYCFNYTEKDIRNDFYEHGRSTIMDRIINEKKDGNCSCESTNPKGR